MVPILLRGGQHGWLATTRGKYFVENQLLERDKLDAVLLCLEEEALDWYQ